MDELGLQRPTQFEILAAEAARAQQHLDSCRQLGLLDRNADELVDDFPYPAQTTADFVPRKREQDGKQHVLLRSFARANRFEQMRQRDAVSDAQVEGLIERLRAFALDRDVARSEPGGQQTAISAMLE